MTPSRYPHITDELLSAYLDDAVTAEEKLLVEAAVADEPALAWRLETLRQTVQLVRTLPAIALPRSFTFNELPGAPRPPVPVLAGSLPAHRSPLALPSQPSGLAALWQGWRSFWQLGSPLLRNAAAVSLALFLLLMAGDVIGSTPLRRIGRSAGAPVVSEAPAVAVATSAVAAPERPAPASAGSIEEADGQVAKESAAPEPVPAGANHAGADEGGAVATAGEGGAASSVSASQPAARTADQEELFASGASASGPAGEEELAPMGPVAAATTNSQTLTAQSLSAAMGTRTALPATGTTTVTSSEGEATDEGALAAAAPLSTPETFTLGEPAQSVATYGAATVEEGDVATPALPTPAGQAEGQAEEAITHTTSTENKEVAGTTGAASQRGEPQQVENVQPSQAVTLVDSLRRSLLDLSQIVTGLVTLVFGLLWWRSRSQPAKKF